MQLLAVIELLKPVSVIFIVLRLLIVGRNVLFDTDAPAYHLRSFLLQIEHEVL